MKPTINTSARPAQVAVTNLSNTAAQASAIGSTVSPTPASVKAEQAQDAEQQYLYRLEQLAFNALEKCKLEVGRALIRDGAAALDDNPAHFDSTGQITASGLDAIIVGGMARVCQKVREGLDNFSSLTRTEINAIRELDGLATLESKKRSASAALGERDGSRFVVFIEDEADKTVSYQIERAQDEDEAERQALDERKHDHDLDGQSDEDAGFRALGAFNLADLVLFLSQTV